MFFQHWSKVQQSIQSTKKQQHATSMEQHLVRRPTLHQEIISADEKLRASFDALRLKNDELEKKHQEINSLRPKITYQTEKQIDSTIRKLENERSIKHFSLPEEQKVIREIDKLKRSKQELVTLHKLMDQRNQLNTAVTELRAARQNRINEVNELKRERKKHDDAERLHHHAVDLLTREISELAVKKASVIREYNRNAAEWVAHMNVLRKAKQEETKQSRNVDRSQQDWHEPVVQDPYAGIKQLIVSLLAYLQPFMKPESETPAPYQGSLAPLRPVTPPSVQIDLDDHHDTPPQPGYFLPRKHDSSVPFKSVGRSKKDKRKNPKPIAHSAPVVAQFGQLDLLPPATTAEVPQVVEQLRAKKEEYDHLSATVDNDKTPKASPDEEIAPPFPAMEGSGDFEPENELRSRIPSITITDPDQIEKLATELEQLQATSSSMENSPETIVGADFNDDSLTSFETEMRREDEAFDANDTNSEMTSATSARSSVINGEDYFSERNSESSRDDEFSPEIVMSRPSFGAGERHISAAQTTVVVKTGDVPDGRIRIPAFADGVCPETPPVDEFYKPPSFIVKRVEE